MDLDNAPISDYEGDEDCVDIGGVVRDIDELSQTITLVDPTGSFKFHFEDSWNEDVYIGDSVFLRGIPTEDEREYTIVGIKHIPTFEESTWELANPNFSNWKNKSLIKYYDKLNWISYDREVNDVGHGYEVYCMIVVSGPLSEDVLGYVPETFVYKWEAEDESSLIDNVLKNTPSIEHLYQNAKEFYHSE